MEENDESATSESAENKEIPAPPTSSLVGKLRARRKHMGISVERLGHLMKVLDGRKVPKLTPLELARLRAATRALRWRRFLFPALPILAGVSLVMGFFSFFTQFSSLAWWRGSANIGLDVLLVLVIVWGTGNLARSSYFIKTGDAADCLISMSKQDSRVGMLDTTSTLYSRTALYVGKSTRELFRHLIRQRHVLNIPPKFAEKAVPRAAAPILGLTVVGLEDNTATSSALRADFAQYLIDIAGLVAIRRTELITPYVEHRLGDIMPSEADRLFIAPSLGSTFGSFFRTSVLPFVTIVVSFSALIATMLRF